MHQVDYERIIVRKTVPPVRRRERKMQRFKSQGQAQLFISIHSAVYNTFSIERHLTSRNIMRDLRAAAMEKWKIASAPAG